MRINNPTPPDDKNWRRRQRNLADPYYGQKRSTPHATLRPHVRDLAWAAGFLEGEATFRYTSPRYGTENIQAAQVNLEPLERLAQLFGGKIRKYRIKTRPISMWYITGARARGVMLTLYAMLSARRREQIQRALAARYAGRDGV